MDYVGTYRHGITSHKTCASKTNVVDIRNEYDSMLCTTDRTFKPIDFPSILNVPGLRTGHRPLWVSFVLLFSSLSPIKYRNIFLKEDTIFFSILLRGGADKSLGRRTSRCRMTESGVSLERGACSCAELQVFSSYRSERKHVRGRARFQQHRDTSCHQGFFSCKARCRRKFTPFW